MTEGVARTECAIRAVQFAVHDAKYPRSARMRESLSSWGYSTETISVPVDGTYALRCMKLLLSAAASRKKSGKADVLILAEFSLQYAWVGRLAAWILGSNYVIDWFVGLVETNIEDWERFPAKSVRGRLHRAMDAWAALCSKLYVTDTELRAEALRARVRPNARVISLPVGAPAWSRAPSPSLPKDRSSRPLRVLYYGNYIPLHGLNYVTAAVRLASHASIEYTFVGDGELRSIVESSVADLPDILFTDPVPPERLAEIIATHDVILGVFGRSKKAQSVIANKVWQGLAAGKIVITGRSKALLEIEPVVGDQLIQVPTGDPVHLSRMLTLASTTTSTESVDLFDDLETYVVERYLSFRDALLQLRE